MAVLTSPPRIRPRFGPQAGLIAAARGVAFAGLMLARFAVPPVLLGVRAQRLVITERAVAKHTASIFLKLDLQPSDDDNRRVLAVLAYLGG